LPTAPKGKTARQAIYDNSGVGSDLRSQKVDPNAGTQINNATPALSKPPPPNVFLKPAGVDEPAESTKSASTAGNTPTPSSDSAERKPKGKREREQTADSAEGESSKKRKRKKKNDQASAAE
jgi:hypothetical protein